MDERQTAERELALFLRQRTGCGEALSPATDLLRAGLLDSLLVMDLVQLLESRYQVALDYRHITPDHFRSVQAIVELLVCLRRGKRDSAPPRVFREAA